MIIRKITIDNFRSFEHTPIFCFEKNVLVGENNTGKTNLLDAINLVLNPDIFYQKGLISELDFFQQKYQQKDGAIVEINIELIIGNLSEDEQHYFRGKAGGWECWSRKKQSLLETSEDTGCFDDPNNEKVFRVAFSARYNEENDEFEWETYYPKLKEEDSSNSTFTKTDKKRIGFFFIRTYKNIDQILSFNANSVLKKILKQRNVNLSSQERQMLEGVKDVGSQLTTNNDFKNLIEEIVKGVENFIVLDKDAEEKIKFELLTLTRSSILTNLKPFIHVDESDQAYPVFRQGGGTRNALIFSLLMKLAEQQDNCILAFEEPEASLHPHLQRALIQHVKEKSNQCFISTHSPYITQPFELGDIHIVKKKDKKTQVFKPEWDEGERKYIERFYKQEVMESLFGKAILLVEGTTDEGFFSEISSMIEKKQFPSGEVIKGFDLLGVTVINCDSKPRMKDFANPLRKLQLPIIAIVDDEESTIKDTDELKKICDLTISMPKGMNLEKSLLHQSDYTAISSFIEAIHDVGAGVFRKLHDKFSREETHSPRDLPGMLRFIKIEYTNNKESFANKIYQIIIDKELNLKSKRYGRLWASQYTENNIPKRVIEIFQFINGFLEGKRTEKYVQLDL